MNWTWAHQNVAEPSAQFSPPLAAVVTLSYKMRLPVRLTHRASLGTNWEWSTCVSPLNLTVISCSHVDGLSVTTPKHMAESHTRSQRIVEKINQPATDVVNDAMLRLWEQRGTLTTFERPQQPGLLDNGKGYADDRCAYDTSWRFRKMRRGGHGRIVGVPLS